MDEEFEARRTRVRVRVGAALVLVFVGLACAVLVSTLSTKGTASQVARPDITSSAAPITTVVIIVHILGAVTNPGLYELHEGDRAIDAVAAAGGFTDVADQGQLNLARFVVDAEQIYVPAIGEVPAASLGGVAGKTNLNTADEAALDLLPRVGPAMAARIISWREANGRFSVIEDLMNVSGIGEKTFDALRDLVTV